MKSTYLHLTVVTAFIGVCVHGQTMQRSFTTPLQGTVELMSAPEVTGNNQTRVMPGQGPWDTGPTQTKFVFEKQATVTFSAVEKDFNPSLLLREMPRQNAEKVEVYNYPQTQKSNIKNKSSLPELVKVQSFVANPWSYSTPNDNDMAISDSGVIVSVMNTNMLVRDTRTGVSSPVKSLAALTSPINNFHQEFDPKVLYDPERDRFIVMCMVGSVDSTSKMVVGFSKTSDPKGAWNLYTLPGNPFNNGLWSDYPMISITKKELFLSVNLLNSPSWQLGFVETVVWQMKKDSGYAGLPLGSVLHSNIKFNGKAVRYLCPAKGGSKLYSPNMYFLSNRNFAQQSDSLFLINITDTIGAPTSTITVKVVKTNLPYYLGPEGRQPTPTHSLQTNDSRNLGAFYENGKIQYTHNTKNPFNGRVTAYYGIIPNPQFGAPSAVGYYIPNDTMDYAYPNISYAGSSSSDDAAIITFDHSSNKYFPGVSAILSDGQGDFSPILAIQNGSTYTDLSFVSGPVERWGDYSGSQRRYNNPGEVWMSGFYGCFFSSAHPKAHATWIAQIFTADKLVGLKKQDAPKTEGVEVFPNPAKDMVSVELNLSQPEYLSFELLNAEGRVIELLLRDWVSVTQNVFSFSTGSLSKGIYFLKISGNNKTNFVKKVIVQ